MRARFALTEPELLSVLRVAAALGAVFLLALTPADADLWGHVRFGEDILTDHSIASRDPYSFTSDRPWINHEWLAEVLMGLAYRAGGGTGIVVLKVVCLGATLALASKTLRTVAWKPGHHDALIGLLIVGMLPRVLPMRPQIFSVVLFATLLFILTRADRGDRRLLIAVPAVMLAWVNVHGGWLVGLGVLSAWVGVRLILRDPGAIARRGLAALWAAALAATLLNPYGTGLWSFMAETVRLERPMISDWQPLLQTSPLVIAPVALMMLTALAALVRGRGRPDPAYALIVVALGLATLRVSRIDVFFALAVVMLLAPRLAPVGAAGAPAGHTAIGALWRRPLAVAIVAAVLVGLSAAAGPKVTCVSPFGAPEPQSVAFMQRFAPRANVLTYFDWGEYAIWHLAPGVKVSMDGRRETVYSDDLFQAHVRLYAGRRGSTSLADRLKPDLIWLPGRQRGVELLEREGWKRAFVGPRSVILSMDLRRPTVRVRTRSQAERCFPDR